MHSFCLFDIFLLVFRSNNTCFGSGYRLIVMPIPFNGAHTNHCLLEYKQTFFSISRYAAHTLQGQLCWCTSSEYSNDCLLRESHGREWLELLNKKVVRG